MNNPATPDSAPNIPHIPLGQVVATPAVLALLERHNLTLAQFLGRHATCDWGDVPPEDAAANDRAITAGNRVLSAYPVGNERIWIITEGDRSSTCVLLPSEY